MSAILIKTAKGKRVVTDAKGKRREIVNERPFRVDAATAAELLAKGGFRLARDPLRPVVSSSAQARPSATAEAPATSGGRATPASDPEPTSSGEAGTPPSGE